MIQGTGFDNGLGCFVGCTLDKYDHEQFSIELGWPMWLAYLADTLFEWLPKEEAPQFGTDLLMAVPVGVDLDQVRVPFLLALQRRNLARLGDNPEPYAVQCRAAIMGVIDWLVAGGADDDAAADDEAAAEAAVWSARLVARAAAAKESAAWAAAEAAEAAAWAARSAWSASASAQSVARSADYQAQRDDLLRLVRAAVDN